MLFNSLEFLVFFPTVFILYWFVFSNSLKIQNILLLISSYYFYACWDYRFLGLIIFSSFVDYFCSLQMRESKLKKKFWLGLSLTSNLGTLFFFKYYNFFADSFAIMFEQFGYSPGNLTLDIILPVGISFYTFQTLSYTIDVYKGKIEPSSNIVSFFAFVSFFPQLVAGPIERASHLLPQFEKKRNFDYTFASRGMRLILWGLFKKLVIADNCAIYTNEIFATYETQPSLVLISGTFYFALQIYGDFSGYSDIAIGLSRLLGFDLMTNFRTPYFSRDISEFWKNWHISLTTWFRDYLYIPLGGNRISELITLRNIFIVFLVSGLWHGANWTFVFWGLLNAIYFIPSFLNKRKSRPTKIKKNIFLENIIDKLSIVKTFTLVCIAWIFFRAENITVAFNYLVRIFDGSFNISTKEWVGDRNLCNLILFFVITEWSIFRHKDFQEIIEAKPATVRHLAYVIIGYLLVIYSVREKVDFIYFQF